MGFSSIFLNKCLLEIVVDEIVDSVDICSFSVSPVFIEVRSLLFSVELAEYVVESVCAVVGVFESVVGAFDKVVSSVV